jgi:hypothetical protein
LESAPSATAADAKNAGACSASGRASARRALRAAPKKARAILIIHAHEQRARRDARGRAQDATERGVEALSEERCHDHGLAHGHAREERCHHGRLAHDTSSVPG